MNSDSASATAGTYAIGDVQGCFSALERLLSRVGSYDCLWLAGDLLNRGPQSRATLSWAHAQQDEIRVVLGNHDLYAIGRWAGIAKPKKSDTLAALLSDDKVDDYFHWLRQQPLFYFAGHLPWILVHAAVDAEWSPADALGHAEEVQRALGGKNWKRFLRTLWESEAPRRWRDCRNEADAQRFRVAVFTRARWVRDDGLYSWTNEAPDGSYLPWHERYFAQQSEGKFVCGHWATQGLLVQERLLALDSGCVWGRQLTAARIDATPVRIVQIECSDLSRVANPSTSKTLEPIQHA
ncbi:symmetrical bis(5'-nucleosyl)-tetraphosphatase [Acidithiobacillus sp. AMEEHan]|uniref:symmetrical bis(5'-nucleosyl)-tetraphosphatase n=1 Tax=Acidithiobacillus sp. AMEEHan TaxID=2994951 RepID=UPI0027E5204F|nr:symmetrical bis(5'-nucleosyl)-tetraphosphatase [Acidithiobacillus sp. AMEEHan]